MELKDKLKKLEDILNGYGQMIVALSGGVDSVFLLAFAHKLWGDDRLAAMTAVGPYFAKDEVEFAQKICDRLGISFKMEDISYVLNMVKRNPEDRCYHCKREIFSGLKAKADMVGSVLADGTNFDDLQDYRPGYKAICELGVASPLKDAGLTKAEIRQALKDLMDSDPALAAALEMDEEGITIWNKPAFACLASRIPYGEMITVSKLDAVYEAEIFMRSRGFKQIRVRCHEIAGNKSGNDNRFMARIELDPEDISRFTSGDMMAETEQTLKGLGFEFVTLDLGGYSKGKMNSLIGKADVAAGAADAAAGPKAGETLAVTEEVVRGNADNIKSADIMAEIDRFLKETREKDYSFQDFVDIIERLRMPGGCPWDREQTHETLRKHLVEEANEVLEAIDDGDMQHLCEELGDVLLQIVLHAQVAREAGDFTIEDVIQGVSEKMIRRHPHVFGNIDVSSVDEGLDLWEEIKKREANLLPRRR